jgi:hypothetical protein
VEAQGFSFLGGSATLQLSWLEAQDFSFPSVEAQDFSFLGGSAGLQLSGWKRRASALRKIHSKWGALAPAFLDLIQLVVFIARAKTSAILSQ